MPLGGGILSFDERAVLRFRQYNSQLTGVYGLTDNKGWLQYQSYERAHRFNPDAAGMIREGVILLELLGL